MSFGGFDQARTHQPISDINVTPLVDVMLVLLVIFIITAPLFASAIKLNLPNVKASAVAQKGTTVTVSITSTGELFWNDIALANVELEGRFKALAIQAPDAQVRLRVDKQVPFDSVAQVLSAAQVHGLTRVGFVTNVPPTHPPSVKP